MKKSIFAFLVASLMMMASNITAVAFNTAIATGISYALGINPIVPILVWNITAIRFTAGTMPTGTLRAGVQKEIWLSVLLENFYKAQAWMTRGRDLSAFVEYNTLNLAEAGVLPTVLVNNSTYPVAVASRTDNPIALALDTLDTENTIVRNIEQMESAYDKMASVVKGHQDALRIMKYKRAAHAYAPASNTTATPVLVCTGGDDGTGRKRLTLEDLAKAQTRIESIEGIDEDVLKTLVLSSLHKEDLILEDKDLFKAFANLETGRVLNLFNFEVSTFNAQAVYNTSTGSKKAFGAAAAGTDSKATSIFYINDEVMYADGDYDMFVEYKSPTERGDIVGFQSRFLALPMRNKGIGAIYSPSI